VRHRRDAREDHVRDLLVQVERDRRAERALVDELVVDEAERFERGRRELDALYEQRHGREQQEGHDRDQREKAN
jgi:hypothetical protein